MNSFTVFASKPQPEQIGTNERFTLSGTIDSYQSFTSDIQFRFTPIHSAKSQAFDTQWSSSATVACHANDCRDCCFCSCTSVLPGEPGSLDVRVASCGIKFSHKVINRCDTLHPMISSMNESCLEHLGTVFGKIYLFSP